MYHLSPYTYLIGGMVGQGQFLLVLLSILSLTFHLCYSAVGRSPINCSGEELVTIQPPGGQTCGAFMAEYIQRAGGYLTNSDATSDCLFCSSRTTDEWLGPTFNIYWHDRWRNLGLFICYIVFNVSRYVFNSSFKAHKEPDFRSRVYISSRTWLA